MKFPLTIPNHRETRDAMVDGLRRRLVGPHGGPTDPLHGSRPTELYISGVLAPQNAKNDSAEDDSLTVGGESEASEDGTVDRTISAAMTNSFKPSSLGLTCVVDANVTHVDCAPRGARYHRDDAVEEEARATIEVMENSSTPGEPPESASRPRRDDFVYRRRDLDIPPFTIDLSKSTGRWTYENEDVEIRWVVRKVANSSVRVLTVAMVNLSTISEGDVPVLRVEEHIFQAGFRLGGADESRPFLPRSLASGRKGDQEDADMQFLYRNRPAFGTGHGCAVTWEDGRSDRVGWVDTETMPAYEIEAVEAAGPTGRHLNMGWLASTEPAVLSSELLTFAQAYADWIQSQVQESASLPPEHAAQARANIDACQETLRRMKQGIGLVTKSRESLAAFRLMNEAMSMQRKVTKPAEDPAWRPFQLAFILQCLPGAMARDASTDPVHVLWFPTGGGKTEAYLGLAAYTICLRRLTAEDDVAAGGVTVLMRYTLRLLTIQQFQRAAALICALERIRRRPHTSLGKVPISIGLWVGDQATPNKLDRAFDVLRQNQETGSTPVQLTSCPACATALSRQDYSAAKDKKSLLITCPNPACEFHSAAGLPVHVIDEEIYRRAPTLVIGTVDKFARIPWEDRTRALFGSVKSWCEIHGYSMESTCQAGQRCDSQAVKGCNPPALVIQDELHLISGPLGTMVGVYEALVDFLCRQAGRSPQVIGSSATIRRAGEQCHNLYGRPIAVFPPRALSAENTFFSRAVPKAEKSGRLYLGVLPAGFSMKTAAVRILGGLLVDGEQHPDIPSIGTVEGNDLRDPYWTIIAYFNSLRELGGAIRLVEDDVPSYMRGLVGGRPQRTPLYSEELTSRKKGHDIPVILEGMSRSLRKDQPTQVYDVIFATNMISVGVDVPRLGTMMVTGQPKATAEYIQATSRVGREYPGLVVTLYNWSRPRDRSHYEDFTDYHGTIYRHVEVNSVTPYTEPALRRGLHALLVGAVRHLEPGMAGNDAAGRFTSSMTTVKVLRDFLEQRLGDTRNPTDPAGMVNRILDQSIHQWAEMCRLSGTKLRYHDRDGQHNVLVPYEQVFDRDETGMPTLNSLRDVEPSTGLTLQTN